MLKNSQKMGKSQLLPMLHRKGTVFYCATNFVDANGTVFCCATALVSAESHDLNRERSTVTYHQKMNTTTISIDTASAITELSRRTWWRRISAGEVTRVTDDDRGRAMLLWSEVEPHICVPVEPEDKQFILLADAGDAEAQDDIGQLFLISEKYQAAFYWFQQAAQQNNPDAMQWLGHCYIGGHGVKKDNHLGLMWISKAAALGHVIAQRQMKGLISRAVDSQSRKLT